MKTKLTVLLNSWSPKITLIKRGTVALMIFVLIGIGTSPIYAQRPSFDKSKDLLMVQFDAEGDEDDIHCMAAFACMKLHPDLDGIAEYIVTGARRKKSTNGIKGIELMEDLFGPPGTEEWTNAWDGDANWNQSVSRVFDKAKAVIQAGGRVWVAEGGQSDFTAEWLMALRADNFTQAQLRNQVVVVQHSTANENHGDQSDLQYTKDNSDYYKIPDGNSGGNGTAGYTSTNTSYYTNARASSNPNAAARTIWNHCHDFLPIPDPSVHNPRMDKGGVDFSDLSETWWILELGSKVDDVPEFWNRYVVNSPITEPCTSSGIQWNMDGVSEFGNNPSAGISNLSVSEGIMSYNAGTDPYVSSSDNLNLCTSGNPMIQIRIKNGTGSDALRFFFSTNSSPGYSADKSVEIPISTNDADFETYEIDMSANVNWTGTLKQLRLDAPDNHANDGGKVEIDFIKIGSNTTLSSSNDSILGNDVGTITLSPTPVENILSISGSTFPMEIQVYDPSGALKINKRLEGENTSIDVNSLASGFYLVRIMNLDNQGEHNTYKMLKN